MAIFNWLFQRRREVTVADIAGRAVALVSESVRPLVEKQLATMSTHEARGYVRARTGHLIREAIAMVTAHDRPAYRLANEAVFDASLNELLRILMRRPSAVAVRSRRAA